MEKLCYTCRVRGFTSCEFKRRVSEIAALVPPNPREEDIVKAQNQIMGERAVAREKICTQLTEVDPAYPGKWKD